MYRDIKYIIIINNYSKLGLGCVTVREEEGAALAAARIIGLTDPLVWCKLKAQQLDKYLSLIKSDQKLFPSTTCSSNV